MHDATDTRHPIHNRLLSVLPPADFSAIRPHLEAVSFEPGVMLARAGDSMRTCFFPNTGMVSLLCVTEQGRSAEAGFAGFEGMIGISVVLGKNEMPYDALVQTPTEGFTCDARAVLDLFNRRGVFHDAVLRFAYVILRQMSQTCVCNHFHTLEARLLPMADRDVRTVRKSALRLTQEFLAHMLGVQRTSIGSIANSLQRTGSIRYTRGSVEIIDLERLRASACDCYRIVKEEYRNFLDDDNFPPMSGDRQTRVAV